ncbi:MAG: putative capsular polysaccharide synthesis family protein [Fuerstiella sp.]|nr:putative capsular polysaccharide synthesis family protein [Fuerstiella sp.]
MWFSAEKNRPSQKRVKRLSGGVRREIQRHKLDDIRFFVLSSGKTGSATLENSFTKHVMHSHTNGYFQEIHPKIQTLSIQEVLENSRIEFGRPPFVLTSIREPVFRAISSFFQNIETHMELKQELLVDLPVQRFVERFLEIFDGFEEYQTHHELPLMGGIDIMKEEFDRNRGYGFYENQSVRLLVLRFDRISSWPATIRDHLYADELEYFRFAPLNVSEDKWYSDIYAQFKEQVRIPGELFNRKMELHEELMHHFFSDEDIAGFHEKYNRIVNR